MATTNPIKYPDLKDIPVSTKTFIVMTNVTLDLRKLYDFLPLTDYTVVPKKRGRKKKLTFVDPNKHVENGSIVTMKFENKFKGVDLKLFRHITLWSAQVVFLECTSQFFVSLDSLLQFFSVFQPRLIRCS